jgi:predicted O-linked N-acetylglucosamine transferase (SPINDLY family)
LITGFKREEIIEQTLLSLASVNAHSFVKSSTTLIRSLHLDVLIYPEIGMHLLTTIFTSHRLATVQLAFWGHPISQGLAAIDYFISSHLYEYNPTRAAKSMIIR